MDSKAINNKQWDRLWEDDKHWWHRTIYFCADDPRIIVPQRHRIGWTWNFSHPLALPILVLAVIPIGFIAWLVYAKKISDAKLLIVLMFVAVAIEVPLLLWVSNRLARRRANR